ncbi:DNA alkylation repair protein [Myxococcus sp. RHSTA-1-4]|uniref:DNA alkylation repair protein n=1 Tax=Myxococcus sp. RHSTA-1-4 TaxID=2874601 RepID=UPI001CC19506|nr:DNA alkylation repair protein [Myxococcus sp. RHSTA-1-4]MBZ4418395.1 DNA alkylation repair protein [Myxococcus sp. RHSTA-1-4]
MSTGTQFKDLFNREAILDLGKRGAAVVPGLNAQAFVREASQGLESMEMKDRVRHLAKTLRRHLAEDYPTALRQLEAMAGSEQGPLSPLRGFRIWPLCHFVEEYGLDHLDDSMRAMRLLTTRFTSEFAIRPFLLRYQEQVLEYLHRWTRDSDETVRRLVSEGTRPRLPWAQRLPAFQKDPTPVLELLEKLKADPALFVRRSVANNLNDIAKDHPDAVVRVVRRWASESPGPETQWLVRHASRTLVKQGHPGALDVLGFTRKPRLELKTFKLSSKSIQLGGELQFHIELHSRAKSDQKLVIDYRIHHRKASGELSPKVFKWTTRQLAAGEQVELKRVHKIYPITTRRYYPGQHLVELLVNGEALGTREFMLSV